MTYCAGWQHNGSIYLIADTAITKNEKPTTNYSSFGQLHTSTKNGFVEESLLKLVPIGKNTAVAFAGNVQIATDIIEILKDNAAATDSIKDLINLADKMGPFNRDEYVELLIASSTSSGDCELFKWDTINGVDQSRSDYYQIGSLTSYHAALTPSLLGYLGRGNLAEDRVLTTFAALVQSYGIYENLIDMNVGGLIFGLWITNGEMKWQEDTNYILYSPDLQLIHYISAISRDNMVIVSSSITNDTRVFCHSVSGNFALTTSPDWQDKVQKQLQSDRFRYWVFLSLKDRVITEIIRNDLDLESKYLHLSLLAEDKFDLSMSPELRTLLLQPIENKNDGSIPFRLNIRND